MRLVNDWLFVFFTDSSFDYSAVLVSLQCESSVVKSLLDQRINRGCMHR
jgi:hypothetical protein